MVLRQRGRCEANLPGVCMYRTTDVNEIQRGPARQDCWLDWTKVSALCAACHNWLTAHPDWAYRHGHQIPHEQIVPDAYWDVAFALRAYFVSHPCTADCRVDHREVEVPDHD